MLRFITCLIFFLAILWGGCQSKPSKVNGNNDKTFVADSISSSELLHSGLDAKNDSIILRVAILGDAEPKPKPEFPNMEAAVDQINTLAKKHHFDFVIGIGDIAHKGTEIQYEAATKVLQKLLVPFYPIMGNEEHGSTVDRYLHYARKWNSQIDSTKYVLEYEQIAFVLASPDSGRDFDDSGAGWILEKIQRLAPKPVVLVVHAAQKGVYPESSEKGVHNQFFSKNVISQPNLAVVLSGDLHMDMDRVNHSKKIDHIHYIHIPALERTKIPDESNHTAMFRVMTLSLGGNITVYTYKIGDSLPLQNHTYSFTLPRQK